MGISLHIEGENSGVFEQHMRGFINLLARPIEVDRTAPVIEVDRTAPVKATDDAAEPVAEAGPNPSVGEAPKRRVRPAKPPVTIEGVATSAENPTSKAPTAEPPKAETTPAVGVVAPEASPTTATSSTTRKPTIDEARTALKAVAALPNGQELGYSVLAKMSVKNVSEAFVKDAEKFMALCAETLAAAAVAA